jgi:hypothetical protein
VRKNVKSRVFSRIIARSIQENEVERQKNIFLDEIEEEEEKRSEQKHLFWWQPHEHSTWIVIWFHITSVVLTVNILLGPMVLLFEDLFETLMPVYYFIDVICVIEIVLNFLIVEVRLDTVKPKEIAYAYFSSTFAFDLFVTCSSNVFFVA